MDSAGFKGIEIFPWRKRSRLRIKVQVSDFCFLEIKKDVDSYGVDSCVLFSGENKIQKKFSGVFKAGSRLLSQFEN